MPHPDRRAFLASTAALALSGLTAHSDEPRTLAVLIFGGELPEVQRDLEKTYRLKVLKGGQAPARKDAKKDEDNVAGLEQLATADLWVGSIHKRTYPSEEQLGHFKKYLAAGKPFVGYRAASHVFQNWLVVDQEVFGATYGGHHLLEKEKTPGLNIELAKGAADHPILKGIEPPAPLSGSYHYTKLAPDVTVLLRSGLPGDMMPHTWVRENAKTKGRVFYTRYDAKDFATNETCRTIFLRGIAWALGPTAEKVRRRD
jgi:type 1 glutamine amidotransferase